MSGEIYNIVKLVPKPGKFNQVAEAFKVFSKYIQEHEPKTQIYFALRPEGSEEFIFVEKFTDQDNLKAHAASSEFKNFSRQIGPCLAQPPEIKRASFVAGFNGRAKI